MFVRLVAFKTHGSAYGIYHAGTVYEVADDKGEAMLDLTSDAGDQVFVEVEAAEAAGAVAPAPAPVKGKNQPKKISIGGKTAAPEGAEPGATVTV